MARQAHPPIHPPPLKPPSAVVAKKSQGEQEAFPPYPHAISPGYATAHPHVTIETIKTAHIPSLTRITGLLLPIRYPNSFYTATITDPVTASLSRVAIYHDHPVAAVPGSTASSGSDKVIGGIRCRLENLPESKDGLGTNLYIQTLHLLSPYRGHGVAAALLNSLLFASFSESKPPHQVSDLVKHYNIRSVTAHVHEANEDGLRWYAARGFKVHEPTVEGYYRRLKPSGAKVVQLRVQREDEQHDPADTGPESAKGTTSQDADEEWEKVEAEDGEEEDHGVQPLSESHFLEKEKTPSKKRKAEDEKGNQPQRRYT
ncbi:hypothetical protein N7492_003236 [Penicillium capsulatum]|uniref:N-acetyltransferase domain-containing protein n=1 Tax=Penicillium capsulatum TaxID=69766 RepID=A0A9W9LVX5_9EURO|nr:hypothetical protein N7492_003236 [Penicillium capsulatum]KAJ6122177.1 hypothetical protein N7512_004642 [Penicillium capsulatum]